MEVAARMFALINDLRTHSTRSMWPLKYFRALSVTPLRGSTVFTFQVTQHLQEKEEAIYGKTEQKKKKLGNKNLPIIKEKDINNLLGAQWLYRERQFVFADVV